MKAALLSKDVRVEGQGRGEMLGKVGGVVAAGVDVEFMRDVACGEDSVEGGGARFEAKVVLVSAIEINLQAGEICFARQGDGAVLFPESWIGRVAEDASQHA